MPSLRRRPSCWLSRRLGTDKPQGIGALRAPTRSGYYYRSELIIWAKLAATISGAASESSCDMSTSGGSVAVER